jgi:hypothetical protein
MRENIINYYIRAHKLLLNIVTAGIEAIILGICYLYVSDKEVCGM